MTAPKVKVGDTVWVYDYSHGTTYREHWRETTITGETRTSWILDGLYTGYSVAKATGKFRGHDHRPLGGFEFTREAVDKAIAHVELIDPDALLNGALNRFARHGSADSAQRLALVKAGLIVNEDGFWKLTPDGKERARARGYL